MKTFWVLQGHMWRRRGKRNAVFDIYSDASFVGIPVRVCTNLQATLACPLVLVFIIMVTSCHGIHCLANINSVCNSVSRKLDTGITGSKQSAHKAVLFSRCSGKGSISLFIQLWEEIHALQFGNWLPIFWLAVNWGQPSASEVCGPVALDLKMQVHRIL